MVWPFAEWGAGSSPEKAREPTLPELNAYDNTPVPDGSHVKMKGNILTGYEFEVISAAESNQKPPLL